MSLKHSIRNWLRARFFRFLSRALNSDDGRTLLHAALAGSGECIPSLPSFVNPPYEDIHFAASAEQARPCVFITGRFRSGSTLLWNVFRNTPGVTAYYEPLNERRWFDSTKRGTHTDKTHLKVEDYWKEYAGLSNLDTLYDEDWTRHRLFLSELAWMPNLQSYIQTLINATSQLPVLQFNRVDFRLPWLRTQFATAKIVHLYRHPRDQWLSSLYRDAKFPTSGSVAEFVASDHFYLLTWCQDLKRHFPFLDPQTVSHPYELHYLIWRLSYQFGKKYADYSLAYEDLVQHPKRELLQLFEALDLQAPTLEDLIPRVFERPQLGKWRQYADERWFAEREAKCENRLAQFFRFQTSEQLHDCGLPV